MPTRVLREYGVFGETGEKVDAMIKKDYLDGPRLEKVSKILSIDVHGTSIAFHEECAQNILSKFRTV